MAYRSMQGSLVRYGKESPKLAFITGQQQRHLVLVGGLTDGMLSLPYTERLSSACAEQGWALVCAQLQSSYQGYGLASLDQDAGNLHELACMLRKHLDCQGFALMGSSTGCQDAVRYAQRYGSSKTAAKFLGAVLQAPVSDREAFRLPPIAASLDRYTSISRTALAEGRGEEAIGRLMEYDGAAFCARRFLSWVDRGGDDDMFSSDFSAAELEALLSHMAQWHTLVLISGADETMPPEVDKQVQIERLVAAMGGRPKCSGFVLQGATHDGTGAESLVVERVIRFIQELQ